jgi:hypothetical protein
LAAQYGGDDVSLARTKGVVGEMLVQGLIEAITLVRGEVYSAGNDTRGAVRALFTTWPSRKWDRRRRRRLGGRLGGAQHLAQIVNLSLLALA